MIIFYPNMIYFCRFQSEKDENSGSAKQSFCIKKLESAEFTNMKHGKPIPHSLIANHVLEVSVKLKFQCVRLKRFFALFCSGGFESSGGLNRFVICFYQCLITPCDLYHSMLLYYYAETEEMIIYKSVNLKGVVYELKLFKPSVYHHTYRRICKCWPDFLWSSFIELWASFELNWIEN